LETLDEDYFKVLNQFSAYDLGFLTADGNVTDTENVSCLEFSLKREDRSILEGIRERMGSNYKLRDRSSVKNGMESLKTSLSISNREIVETLIGDYRVLPKKTYIDSPAPAIPDELFNHYVRGYLDGDGGVWISKVRGTHNYGMLGLPLFLESVQGRMCGLVGIPKNKISRMNHSDTGISVIQWSSRYHLKKLYYWTYPEGDYPFLPRKRDRLRLYVEGMNEVNPSLPSNNTSGYMGVGFRKDKKNDPWTARVSLKNGSVKWDRVRLGDFESKLIAAYAYNCAAILCYRDRARINIIDVDSIPIEVRQDIERRVLGRLRDVGFEDL
jgi:hypothetical protein